MTRTFPRRRTGSAPASRRFARWLERSAATCVGALLVGLPTTASSQGHATDLLRLNETALAATVPVGWRHRAVRGARAPSSRVVDSAGVRFLRVEGVGAAGWLVSAVDPPIAVGRGALVWRWRVSQAPTGADLRSPETDDAAIRVFVAFGPLRALGRPPRTIFYSLGTSEPDGYARIGHGSQDVYVIRTGSARAAERWIEVRVDPFADYRRAWGGVPPPIAVVGLLQDTEQTRGRAVADIASLTWTTSDATDLLSATGGRGGFLFNRESPDGAGRHPAAGGGAARAHGTDCDRGVCAHRIRRDGKRDVDGVRSVGSSRALQRFHDW